MTHNSGSQHLDLCTIRSQLTFCFLTLFLAGCDGAMQPKETPLQAYRGDVPTLALTPDGIKLATTCATHPEDGTMTVWDLQTGKSLVTLKAHKDGAVIAIAFTPLGDLMATGSNGYSVKLWNTATWKDTASWKHNSGARQLQFVNGAEHLLITSLDGVEVREVRGGKVVRKFQQKWTHRFSLSADKKDLVSVTNDSICYWDYPSGKLLAKVVAHTTKRQESIFDVCHSPDGKQIVTVGVDQTIRLWDTTTRKELAQVTGLRGRPNRVAFSPDGRTVAAVTGIAADAADGGVYLWRTNGEKPFAQQVFIKKHATGVEGLAFSPDSKILATSSRAEGGRILIIDVEKEFKTK